MKAEKIVKTMMGVTVKKENKHDSQEENVHKHENKASQSESSDNMDENIEHEEKRR